MGTVTFGNKTYEVETSEEFIADPVQWDEDFARGMAPKVGIISGLSDDHWKIIHFIRNYYNETGKCPLVYETCRMNRLHLQELKTLFPSGYLRGACKIAGITYKDGFIDQSWAEEFAERVTSPPPQKSYEIDVRGFLINPYQWDDKFAVYRAWDMKMPKMTDRHWQVIRYLRKRFEKENLVPTVYDTCEALDMDLNELQELFPDGYHRGAVKIAGLRVA